MSSIESNSTVEMIGWCRSTDDAYWAEIRHEPLSETEEGIDNMIDSLRKCVFSSS